MADVSRTQPLIKYVFNASSLINLERHKGLSLLDKLQGRIVIPKRVAREVNTRGTPLERWLTRNRKSIVDFLPEESRLYLQLLGQRQPKIHDGEAAAIAVATHRKCTLVIDEGAPVDKAREYGTDCLTTDKFLQRLLF